MSGNALWKKIFEDENSKQENNDLLLGLGFFLLGCCIYAAKITEQLPNPDAIWNGVFFKDSCQWEISLGRYMIGLFQALRAHVINTSFITLTCLVLLSIICIFVLKIFDIRTLGWKLVVGALVIISPTVGSTLTYYYCSDMYMLSYLLAVLAVWLMVRKGGRYRIVFASILLMFSAAIYQAYISLAVFLCFIYLMKMLADADISSKDICRKSVSCLLSGSIGVALYLLSNKLVQKISMIEAPEDRGFSKMGMISFKGIHEQIRQCYSYFWQYYFSDSMINNHCYRRKYINAVFFAVLAVTVLSLLLKQDVTIRRKLAFTVLCLLFPLVSMNICIMAPEVSIFDSTGVLMLPTMNFVYISAVAIIQILNAKGSRRICGVGILVGTGAVFLMLLYLELGAQSYMRYNMMKTYNVASQIEARASQYAGYDKMCIIGNMEEGNYPEIFPELARSQHWVTAGYKTIWPDFKGCQNCWLQFMKQYLGREYNGCALDEYYNIISTPEYWAMGKFPDTSGMAVINDIIVIKLSDAAW